MFSYSPFAKIRETNTYPHARFLRTPFLQKLWDTYHVIAGRIVGNQSLAHLGIFDYLTLFIPFALIKFQTWCEDKQYDLLSHVPLIVNLILLIPRIILGAVTTLLFLPIVGILHGISSLIAGQSHSNALDVVGVLEPEEGTKSELTLRNYLAQTELGIEEVRFFVPTLRLADLDEEPEENNASTSYEHKLVFWRKSNNNKLDAFSVKIKKDDVINHASNIHNLFALNIGKATNTIEDSRVISNEDKRVILQMG